MSSAEGTHDLQEACKRILRRLQKHQHQAFPCFLCGISVVDGEEKLMAHLELKHGARVCHFSDVVDLDGFLDCLKARIDLSTCVRCPVCLVSVGEGAAALDALKAHMEAAAHTAWNGSTIPELAAFCLPTDGDTASSDEASAKQQMEEEEDGICKHKGRNDVDPDGAEEELLDSEDEDWSDSCVCLFCPVESDECLAHMASEHAFDLRETLRRRADVRDEYDIIRLINAVRRCVAAGKCPFTYGEGGNGEEGGTSCDVTGTLEEHLRQFPEHRLPMAIPRGSDAELIPFLPGDALISVVVTAGEGFLAVETEDPDFPMAPTLQEVAAYGMAQSRKEARAANGTVASRLLRAEQLRHRYSSPLWIEATEVPARSLRLRWGRPYHAVWVPNAFLPGPDTTKQRASSILEGVPDADDGDAAAAIPVMNAAFLEETDLFLFLVVNPMPVELHGLLNRTVPDGVMVCRGDAVVAPRYERAGMETHLVHWCGAWERCHPCSEGHSWLTSATRCVNAQLCVGRKLGRRTECGRQDLRRCVSSADRAAGASHDYLCDLIHPPSHAGAGRPSIKADQVWLDVCAVRRFDLACFTDAFWAPFHWTQSEEAYFEGHRCDARSFMGCRLMNSDQLAMDKHLSELMEHIMPSAT